MDLLGCQVVDLIRGAESGVFQSMGGFQVISGGFGELCGDLPVVEAVWIDLLRWKGVGKVVVSIAGGEGAFVDFARSEEIKGLDGIEIRWVNIVCRGYVQGWFSVIDFGVFPFIHVIKRESHPFQIFRPCGYLTRSSTWT